MKSLLAFAIGSILSGASFAIDVSEIVEKEGVFRFCDGSSFYALHKDGRFHLTPVGISGRTISGRWESDGGSVRIEGTWSWMNGISPPNDVRTMLLQVTPRGEKERVGHHNELVTKVYFTIESLKKKEGR